MEPDVLIFKFLSNIHRRNETRHTTGLFNLSVTKIVNSSKVQFNGYVFHLWSGDTQRGKPSTYHVTVG